MNPFEMVVAIIVIVMVASVIKTRIRAQHGIVADEDGNERSTAASDAVTLRMRDELQALKERVAVLERLATDEHGSRALDREIERLR